MKKRFWAIAMAGLLGATWTAAQAPVAVDDGQLAISGERGAGASPLAVPTMQDGGNHRIAMEGKDTPPPPAPAIRRKVALVVQNHCTPLAGIPVMALTDALAAKLTGTALRVVNPHNAIGSGQNTTFLGEDMPTESAVELARELRAEGIVTASVTEFQESTFGRGPDAYQFSARVTLNLADAGSGAGVCGVTTKKSSRKYTAREVEANRLAYLGDLLHSAVEECADKLLAVPAIAEWVPDAVPGNGGSKRRNGPLRVAEADEVFQRLLEQMRMAPRFRERYGAAQAEMGRRPIAIVGGIADKTGEGLADVLDAASDGIRVTLGNSGLFDTKDDGMMVTFAERIIASGNSPLEDAELMGSLKQHGSPDFYVEGDLKSFPGVYRARLALHGLHDGKIVWEGIQEILK